MFLPPKVKDTRKSKELNRPSSNPIIHKAVKEHYHNPDPIACLIGKVNEAHILVDDVECLALVGSGVQLSIITHWVC